jgi:hypothetical protein
MLRKGDMADRVELGNALPNLKTHCVLDWVSLRWKALACMRDGVERRERQRVSCGERVALVVAGNSCCHGDGV